METYTKRQQAQLRKAFEEHHGIPIENCILAQGSLEMSECGVEAYDKTDRYTTLKALIVGHNTEDRRQSVSITPKR